MKLKNESEVAQLCLTLSDLMDCSLPGSSVHWIFQARVLEWGAIAFSGLLPYTGGNLSSERLRCAPKVTQSMRGRHILVRCRSVGLLGPKLPFFALNSGFPGGSDGKESACNGSDPWVRKTPCPPPGHCVLQVLVLFFAFVGSSQIPTVGGVCNFLGSVSSQQKFEATDGPVLQLPVTAQFYLESKGKMHP